MNPSQATTVAADPVPEERASRFRAGAMCGTYRIVRLLGRGGMGEVYEADATESGRRVALKVLRSSLVRDVDRERFLREGRLAASVNHPHTVYVFGIEEDDGVVAIVMELMTGQTLADRVKTGGRLTPMVAVDYILDVIAGLDAAAAAGVLHRDVKPSNCFLDQDGTVKIGDFGLSISTAPTEDTQLTTVGTVLGTPAFAAPEQLRGESLDLRADVYGVGATLYYLLTGHPPFTGANVMEVLTAVALGSPRPPHEVCPDVPIPLSAAVVRCLHTQRDSRCADYGRLAHVLAPFASTAPKPARLGKRFLAGLTDVVPLILLRSVLSSSSSATMLNGDVTTFFKFQIVYAIVETLYFGIAEGKWGATPGKILLNLRVIDAEKGPPGLLRGLARAAVYTWTPGLPFLCVVGGMLALRDVLGVGLAFSRPGPLDFVVFYSLVPLAILASLFLTARRRNGFAAVHDLMTGTRVVEKATAPRAAARRASPGPVVPTAHAEMVGPYLIVEPIATVDRSWMLGFDPRLKRQVWVHRVPVGTPPLAPLRRDLARPGRLRWLAGRRQPGDSWDAFEALDGDTLSALLPTPQPWHVVRGWLHDLARELEAAARDGSLPSLSIDRVWITRHGGATLLDTPAPSASNGPSHDIPPQDLAPARFLHAVAVVALGLERPGSVTPNLPLHARLFLDKLGLEAAPSPDVVVRELAALVTRPTTMTWQRRLVCVSASGSLTMLSVMAMAFLGIVMTYALIAGTRFKQPTGLSPRDGYEFGASIAHVTCPPCDYVPWVVVLLHLAVALACKGVFLRACGAAIVANDGSAASRARVFLRTVITWSPLLLVVMTSLWFRSPWLPLAGIAVMTLGAVWAVAFPNRGLQDWLAGTFVVPE